MQQIAAKEPDIVWEYWTFGLWIFIMDRNRCSFFCPGYVNRQLFVKMLTNVENFPATKTSFSKKIKLLISNNCALRHLFCKNKTNISIDHNHSKITFFCIVFVVVWNMWKQMFLSTIKTTCVYLLYMYSDVCSSKILIRGRLMIRLMKCWGLCFQADSCLLMQVPALTIVSVFSSQWVTEFLFLTGLE